MPPLFWLRAFFLRGEAFSRKLFIDSPLHILIDQPIWHVAVRNVFPLVGFVVRKSGVTVIALAVDARREGVRVVDRVASFMHSFLLRRRMLPCVGDLGLSAATSHWPVKIARHPFCNCKDPQYRGTILFWLGAVVAVRSSYSD